MRKSLRAKAIILIALVALAVGVTCMSGGELRAEVSADYFRYKCLYDRTFGSVNAHY